MGIRNIHGNTKYSISQNRRETQQLALSKLSVTFECPLSLILQLIKKNTIGNLRKLDQQKTFLFRGTLSATFKTSKCSLTFVPFHVRNWRLLFTPLSADELQMISKSAYITECIHKCINMYGRTPVVITAFKDFLLKQKKIPRPI